MNFSSHKKDLKKFETNNKSIALKFESNNKSVALNIQYVLYKTEEIRHVYKSKHNFPREKFLMITDGKKWHYLLIKNCLHYLGE